MSALVDLAHPAAFAVRPSRRSTTLASFVRDRAGVVREPSERACAVAAFHAARSAQEFGGCAGAARPGEHLSPRTGEASRGSTSRHHESEWRKGLTGPEGELRASASGRPRLRLKLLIAPATADQTGLPNSRQHCAADGKAGLMRGAISSGRPRRLELAGRPNGLRAAQIFPIWVGLA